MSDPTSKEILEARAKMAEKFGDVKLGGKGIFEKLMIKEPKEKLNLLSTETTLFKIKKFHQ